MVIHVVILILEIQPDIKATHPCSVQSDSHAKSPFIWQGNEPHLFYNVHSLEDPILFVFFYEDWLPEDFIVCGFAQTKMTNEEIRNTIGKTLSWSIDKKENCEAR